MEITWYGTATIGIDNGKTRLLFDPFVRMNKRIETTPVEGFAGFDAVLITHGHFDHLYSIPNFICRAQMRAYVAETV
ncbi:MAG: MBL fold metallo-hydrolase [Clostridia bacterium]|nr:MBL fold metallo-hydrolase [Clostridia bacterium]